MTEREYKNYLHSISPIIYEKPIWDAFLIIMNFEQDRLKNSLCTNLDTDKLIRVNAQITILETLKRYRDTHGK